MKFKTFLNEYITGQTEDKIIHALEVNKFTCKSDIGDMEDFILNLKVGTKINTKDAEEIIDDYFKKLEC